VMEGRGHRHRRVSTRRRETVPGCVADERARRRASDPAHNRCANGRLGCRDAAQHSATNRIAPAPPSPLYAAEDAIVVDTTSKNVDEVVQEALAVIRAKGLKAQGSSH
jgi:cytidylate kinase